jgi:hypothetical protein
MGVHLEQGKQPSADRTDYRLPLEAWRFFVEICSGGSVPNSHGHDWSSLF